MKRALHSLYPILRLWSLAYYRAALRQIDPLHPDVPHIVRRINFWEAAR